MSQHKPLTLQEELYRLLYDHAYRETFLAGRWDELGFDPETRAALAGVDRGELRKVAELIARTTRSGRSGPIVGGLEHCYPGVFARLVSAGRDLDQVILAFLASPEHAGHQVVPFVQEGPCCEEAFYHFMARDAAYLAAESGNRAILRHEFLCAIFQLLAINEAPNFSCGDPAFHRVPSGYWAIERYTADEAHALPDAEPAGGPALMLYAASRSQFITARVGSLVQRLLESETAESARERARELGREHQTSPSVVLETASTLDGLGLLAGGDRERAAGALAR